MARIAHLEAGADSSVSALETHRVKCSLAFAHGEISVVEHSWAHATSDVWKTDDYFLNMAINGRTGPAHATYLDGHCGISESIGRVMIVPPGRAVRSVAHKGKQRTLLCTFRQRAIEDLLDRAPNWSRNALAKGLHLNNPEVEWFLLRIYDELMRPGFAQQVMIDSLASGAGVALVRAFNFQDDCDRPNMGGLAPWRLREIRDRIQSDEPLPQLTELAELCGMSVRHLTRAFRIETGMTVAKYVENAMVERARNLLGNSGVSISEIARLLGFSSASSFTYAFRRATGMLPSELRHCA